MSGKSRWVRSIVVALSVLFGIALLAGTAGAAKPDLIITAVSSKPSASAGGKLQTTVTVRNRGGRAAPSLTGFSLSRDRIPGRDIALGGSARTGALKPGQSARSSAGTSLPRSIPGRSYFLIACSDVARKVREVSERNNCRASKAPVRVTPGGPGKLAFLPSSWSFGSLDIEAEEPLSKVLNLKNTGGKTLPPVSDLDFEGFTGFLPEPGECIGEALSPGETCPVEVKFIAFETGSHSATVTLTAENGVSASVSVSGTGVDVVQPAVITMDPATRDFGTVVSGNSSAATSFNVFHDGEADSGPLDVSISGPDASQFVIGAPSCQGQVLSERTLCAVKVEFRPTSAGPKSATLQVSASPGGSRTASLSGTGLAAASLSISPAIRNFGNITAGQESEVTIFTVTNNGAGPAGTDSMLNPQITGGDATSFALDFATSNCGQTLAPGASCALGVWFRPAVGSTGAKTASLNVSAAPGGTASASLSGTATRPLNPAEFSVSPGNYDFGSVPAGDTVTSNTVFTVINTGEVTSSAVLLQVAGGGGAYSIVDDNCRSVPTTLAPGASCSFKVTFSPFPSLISYSGGVNVFGVGIPGTSLILAGTRS
jgi:hypothetical protein